MSQKKWDFENRLEEEAWTWMLQLRRVTGNTQTSSRLWALEVLNCEQSASDAWLTTVEMLVMSLTLFCTSSSVTSTAEQCSSSRGRWLEPFSVTHGWSCSQHTHTRIKKQPPLCQFNSNTSSLIRCGDFSLPPTLISGMVILVSGFLSSIFTMSSFSSLVITGLWSRSTISHMNLFSHISSWNKRFNIFIELFTFHFPTQISIRNSGCNNTEENNSHDPTLLQDVIKLHLLTEGPAVTEKLHCAFQSLRFEPIS